MPVQGVIHWDAPLPESVFDLLLDPEHDLLGHGESEVLVRQEGIDAMGDGAPLLLREAIMQVMPHDVVPHGEEHSSDRPFMLPGFLFRHPLVDVEDVPNLLGEDFPRVRRGADRGGVAPPIVVQRGVDELDGVAVGHQLRSDHEVLEHIAGRELQSVVGLTFRQAAPNIGVRLQGEYRVVIGVAGGLVVAEDLVMVLIFLRPVAAYHVRTRIHRPFIENLQHVGLDPVVGVHMQDVIPCSLFHPSPTSLR